MRHHWLTSLDPTLPFHYSTKLRLTIDAIRRYHVLRFRYGVKPHRTWTNEDRPTQDVESCNQTAPKLYPIWLSISQPKHCCVAQDTSVPVPNSTAADSSLHIRHRTSNKFSMPHLYETAQRATSAYRYRTWWHLAPPHLTNDSLCKSRLYHGNTKRDATTLGFTLSCRCVTALSAASLRRCVTVLDLVAQCHYDMAHRLASLHRCVTPFGLVALRHCLHIASPYFAPPLLYRVSPCLAVATHHSSTSDQTLP